MMPPTRWKSGMFASITCFMTRPPVRLAELLEANRTGGADAAFCDLRRTSRLCGLGGLLGCPEDLVDALDEVEELLALLGVHRLLGLAGLLGGLPEQLVQLGMLLDVLGLEVVGPEHPEVMLDEV